MMFAFSDMWVKEDALGAELELTAPGAEPTVMLKIPSKEAQWVTEIDDLAVFSGYNTYVNGPLASASVVLVRVEVVYRNRTLRHLTEKTLADAGSKLAAQSRRTAEVAVAKFTDHIRVLGQFWLGLSMQKPDLVDGPCLWELEKDQDPLRLPGGAMMGTIFLDRPKTAASLGELVQAAAHTAENAPPALDDILLSDAKQLARLDSLPALRHAVLLAAVSTELKIKSSVVALASDEQRELVRLLFDKPRDYSVAAVALLDDPLRIVSGTSLREADPLLYKAVEQLFRVRNKIVHSGEPFEPRELYEAVNAAQGLSKYLSNSVASRSTIPAQAEPATG